MASPRPPLPSVSRVTRIVFTALLVDILAFTIILPLFPRLLQYYRDLEQGDQNTLLAWSLNRLTEFQSSIGLLNDQDSISGTKRPPKTDIVLLGGALGSLFSVLQFICSPMIGKLSDSLGRRRVLLWSMIGNLVSCAVWLFSSSFELFVLSRVIGGLCEGNVQLSIAMISDITTPKTRSRGLAMVGIAFAIAFTIGPALGAFFANKDLSKFLPGLEQYGLHPFSGSAMVALVLLSLESVYLWFYLPETNHDDWRRAVKEAIVLEKEQEGQQDQEGSSLQNGSSKKKTTVVATPVTIRPAKSLGHQQSLLTILSATHFAHLFLFSGMEFTLTFLTFHLFDFSHMQQGALLGYIGILSSLIQGGYVRRRAHQVGEKRMVIQGIAAAAIGLGCIAIVAGGGDEFVSKHQGNPSALQVAWNSIQLLVESRKAKMYGLYAGATGLAVTSATVVNCLTSLASLVCDMPIDSSSGSTTTSSPSSSSSNTTSTATRTTDPIGKGLALGRFRSWGQLGRAAGPIAACSLYWRVGPMMCYGTASVAVFVVALIASKALPEVRELAIRGAKKSTSKPKTQ